MYTPAKPSNSHRYCHAFLIRGRGSGRTPEWVATLPLSPNKDGTYTLLEPTPVKEWIAEMVAKYKKSKSELPLIIAKDAVIPIGYWVMKDSEGNVYGVSDAVFSERWKYKFWLKCIQDEVCSVEETGRTRDIFDRMPKDF